MRKTLFEITKEIGQGIPFAVKHELWPNDLYMVIFHVGSHKLTKHQANKAFGIPFYLGKQIKTNYIIGNAHHPVWEELTDLSLSLFETDKILKLNTTLYSGKYSGQTMLDIIHTDIKYIMEIIDDSKYALDPNIFDFLTTLNFNLFPIDYINRNQRRFEMIRQSQIKIITIKSRAFDTSDENFQSENSPVTFENFIAKSMKS